MLEIFSHQRDAAHMVLMGEKDFEAASPGERALLITRILHSDLAEILDRPEEFYGPGLPEEPMDSPSRGGHARIHALVLANAMENDDAAKGSAKPLVSRKPAQQRPRRCAPIHVLMMIQLQQVWGVAVAAQGETEVRRREGAVALKQGNRWFAEVSEGRVKKLP